MKKKENAIDLLMSRATDFTRGSGKVFEVAREMDVDTVEPVTAAGHANFEHEVQLDTLRASAAQATDTEERSRLAGEIATAQARAEERARKRQVTFVSTTAGLDRHGTRIRTEGIDLGNYERNPIFAWGHDAYGTFFGPPEMENILGKSIAIRKGVSRMEQDIEFATEDVNPRGDRAFRMVMARMLNTTSIGFIPKQVVIEVEDERNVPVIVKAELLETSLVPIPSNPEALALVREMAKADMAKHRGAALRWGCRHQHAHDTPEEAEQCSSRAPEDQDIREIMLPALMKAMEQNTHGLREKFAQIVSRSVVPPATAAASGTADLEQAVVKALRRVAAEIRVREGIRSALR